MRVGGGNDSRHNLCQATVILVSADTGRTQLKERRRWSECYWGQESMDDP